MITIGYSTREYDEKYYDHIIKTCGIKTAQIIPVVNPGKYSLSEAYNIILEQSENDIVILIHDDLIFETKNWGHKLKSIIKKNNDFGILGLAGSKHLPKSGMWWEIPETMYGIVNHQNDGKKWTSKYSSELKNKVEETIMVDGLFMVLVKSKIKTWFDETVDGFHFYDMDFCFSNYTKGVKIGVTTAIRVTHLSIGATNDEWERKRIEFSEKYKNHLPVDIMNYDDIDTFIVVHDQNIILEFEKSGKYNGIKNLTYLFVGNNPYDKIEDLNNLIVCRNLTDNLESFPNINAFTAWYTIWKNNLCSKKYLNIFEYDTNFSNKLFKVLSKNGESGYDMIRYVPMSTDNFHFINNPNWVNNLFKGISEVYKIDLKNHIENNRLPIWTTTSNTSFRYSVFKQYMDWFSPLLPYLLNDPNAGHAHERSITFFSYMKKKKIIPTNGLIEHLQMNSHNTQEHSVDYVESMSKLINSNI